MNWDLGHYEHLAPQLRPAAEAAVERLALRRGEVVLDLGCGTGNAALLASGRGATVIGVDPSPRLLAVARSNAIRQELDVAFLPGDAADLPVADDSVDAIVSVFAVIFAPDVKAAAAEVARVLRPGGRFVLSAWLREGALADQARFRREILSNGQPQQPDQELFAWHEEQALLDLLQPFGFSVSVHAHTLTFTGESPADYARAQLEDHPLWVRAGPGLKANAQWDRVQAHLTKLFTDANEDPGRFRFTSRYVIATARLRA
jgi:SAM-dependent methyltransferase